MLNKQTKTNILNQLKTQTVNGLKIDKIALTIIDLQDRKNQAEAEKRHSYNAYCKLTHREMIKQAESYNLKSVLINSQIAALTQNMKKYAYDLLTICDLIMIENNITNERKQLETTKEVIYNYLAETLETVDADYVGIGYNNQKYIKCFNLSLHIENYSRGDAVQNYLYLTGFTVQTWNRENITLEERRSELNPYKIVDYMDYLEAMKKAEDAQREIEKIKDSLKASLKDLIGNEYGGEYVELRNKIKNL